MKKIGLILLLAFALLIPVRGGARTFALVVGVSQYDNAEANLLQTAKDAKAFRDVLLTQTKDVSILTSKYANHANILEKLSAICNRAGKGDRIIFYFSGHGSDGCLITSDLKALTYDNLVEVLSNTKASEVICFIDACHAGSVAQTAARNGGKLSARDGQAFLVSSRSNETSREAAWIGQGYFTQALLKGIRGKSDYNDDKKVTLLELFKYIHSDVRRRSDKEQNPVMVAPKQMLETVVAEWE